MNPQTEYEHLTFFGFWLEILVGKRWSEASGGLDEAIYYFKVGSINRRKWWSWTGSSHTNSHRS